MSLWFAILLAFVSIVVAVSFVMIRREDRQQDKENQRHLGPMPASETEHQRHIPDEERMVGG